MALDRAVLRAHAAGETPPTLRLYRWRVPTVTLGRFQDVADVDLELCRERGFDVVRRPTGGRGVLHDDELTYSIVAGTRDGVPRGVSASYRYLCAALAEAYARLGVAAELTSRPRGEAASGACYLHSTHADLSLGAAKLSGSAQVWDRDSVLQHGSFVRSRRADVEARIFRLDDRAKARLSAGTATLEDALGTPPGVEVIERAVVEAVEACLDVRLVEGALTRREREDAEASEEEFRVLGLG